MPNIIAAVKRLPKLRHSSAEMRKNTLWTSPCRQNIVAQPHFVSTASWSRTGFITARCSSGMNAADSAAVALSIDEMEKNDTA